MLLKCDMRVRTDNLRSNVIVYFRMALKLITENFAVLDLFCCTVEQLVLNDRFHRNVYMGRT